MGDRVFDELERLALHDPIAHSAVTMRRQGLARDDVLVVVIKSYADVYRRLQEDLTRLYRRMPSEVTR